MAQYTALEWFYEEIIIKGKTNYYDLFEQAKAMEKEQIMNAYWNGTTHMEKQDAMTDAEKFYNEYYSE